MVSSRRLENPVVLVILDGWGISQKGENNAISLAKTPNFDFLEKKFGHLEVCASGECVGLTPGQMGNSEVGHLTIGAGRIIFQDLMRVSDEINTGRLARNLKLLSLFKTLEKEGGRLHLMGLVSDGGVHSHIEHLLSLLKIARENCNAEIFIHVFLDGRDTPPQSGAGFAGRLQDKVHETGKSTIATIAGRFYAMDRDLRWDRTKLAFDAIVYGEGKKFDDPVSYIKNSYESGTTDEFVVPGVAKSYDGVRKDDAILFFNFRPDRARQLTRALSMGDREFGHQFDRRERSRPKRIRIISMTVYDTKFRNVEPLLKREHIRNTLGNVLERERITQLHVAETEKYAHVTYFFNGLVEKPRKFEDRILVPSLKIGTYDQKPEMSAKEIAHETVRAIDGQKYGFVLVNFANADMVGHSGNLDPTIRAVETVDTCLGLLVNAWKRSEKLTMMVTADHGNAEKMFNHETNQPHTAHTSNPVPLIVVSNDWKIDQNAKSPGLVDIAPSVLRIMGIRKPKAMSGTSIVTRVE